MGKMLGGKAQSKKSQGDFFDKLEGHPAIKRGVP